tara:strand:+ start:275 stop:985 length:711 start_codon:yes stop_codon:yes gene_type:complete
MAWIEHVKKTRAATPGMSYKDAMVEAKKTYKRLHSVLPAKAQKGSGLEHARFSSEIYKKPKDRQDVQDYKYMGGDSEKGYWQSTKNIIISYRGTVTKQDVKTDALLAVGALKASSRFKKDLSFAKRILKIANVPVIITGHSLGGSIATEIGRELGLKVWAYNAGVGPRQAVRNKTDKIACLLNKKGKKCRKAKLVNHERTFGDPVSILGRKGMNTKHVIPKKINVHSVDNFKMLKD